MIQTKWLPQLEQLLAELGFKYEVSHRAGETKFSLPYDEWVRETDDRHPRLILKAILDGNKVAISVSPIGTFLQIWQELIRRIQGGQLINLN